MTTSRDDTDPVELPRRPSAVPVIKPPPVARGRELEPEPITAGDLVLAIGEFKEHLAHVEGLFGTLATRLSQYQLQLLNADHAAGVAIDLNRTNRDALERLTERVGKLEAEAAE